MGTVADLNFIAVDVETACPDLSSICQFAFAEFENGECVKVTGSLVNPNVPFSPHNTRVHGITSERVAEAAAFANHLETILSFFRSGKPVVSHSPFDQRAFEAAFIKCEIDFPDVLWLDSITAARVAWPDHKGYRLNQLAETLGIAFDHHDAREDARVAGHVLVHALKQLQTDLKGYLESGVASSVPSNRGTGSVRRWRRKASCSREGDPNGPLVGHSIVFTGELSITREVAAQHAAKAGCHVENGVTKKTTLLVVGDQDLDVLNGHTKSSKHRKAEALIEKGQEILILQESDFMAIVKWSESAEDES
jgi:DNA polymerase-3 subunit epsilon